jgi:NADH:ubiquinone oxidoreductase subunit 6 (subunit J)
MDTVATVLFWFTLVFTAASALLVATSRKILHAAFALCLCFLGVGGIYLFLHADFLAAVQLIVYVGGILVLILFAVMFSSHTQDSPGESARSPLALGAGALAAGAAFLAIVLMLIRLAKPFGRAMEAHGGDLYRHTASVAPGEEGLGHLLMGQYLLPFELASIVILAALLGAVVIARKETR